MISQKRGDFVIQEVISNTFNLIIDREETPPLDQSGLEVALKEYMVQLKRVKKSIQMANEKIARNVFELKTHKDVIAKFRRDGEKKTIVIDDEGIELNTDYLFTIGQYFGDIRKVLLTVFEKDGKSFLGTYTVEVVEVLAQHLRSPETLFLEANGGDVGLVLYGGTEKALQPNDQLSGQIQLGTPWGAWKNVFTISSYSSDGIFINDAIERNRSMNSDEDVLDRINFITTMRNGSANLNMDVTAIKDTDYVKYSDKSNEVYVNQGELLKLALFEIKKLKREIEGLKDKEKEAANESI